MNQTDDDIRNLNPRVVDVVLYTDVVPRLISIGTKKALEGIAQDGIAQMADVSSFVGIDAGVLDKAEARTADICVLIGRDTANCGGTIETNVQVACSRNLDAGNAL